MRYYRPYHRRRDVTFDIDTAIMDWHEGSGRVNLLLENQLHNLPLVITETYGGKKLCYKKMEICQKLIDNILKAQQKGELGKSKGVEQELQDLKKKKERYVKLFNAFKTLEGMCGEL